MYMVLNVENWTMIHGPCMTMEHDDGPSPQEGTNSCLAWWLTLGSVKITNNVVDLKTQNLYREDHEHG